MSPATATRYVYLGDKLIAEIGAGGTEYAHTDALGSPVARTNATGGLISRTRYEAYGKTAAGAEPGVSAGSIGFTGHVNDPQTGLVYMQQRYYDPIAGRFLSVDPVTTDANTGSVFSRYAYANNSPYTYKDPDGRVAVLLPMIAGGFIGGGINLMAQFARSGGEFSQVNLKQVGVAAVAGAAGGGAGAVASMARTVAGAIGANVTTGAAVGATAAHASAAVNGQSATVGDVLQGAALGGGLSGVAGVVAAAPGVMARSAASGMSSTEKTATENIAQGIADATRSAGGNVRTSAAGQAAADAAAATIGGLDNVTAKPKSAE